MADIITLALPPRPASGNGDVVVPLGKTDVRFSWTDGDLTAVGSESRKIMAYDEKMQPETTGIVTCEKCARDTETGQKVCWSVPC